MKQNKDASNKKEDSINLAAQAGAANEVINRFGSASKEHLVAYSGKDNEFERTLKRGLKKTSESKINPEYAKQNIKQQAGFAAEDKYTARQNAEKIISGSQERYSRTDDLGRVNDPLHDHVLLDANGIEVPGSGEQMKFVGSNPVECLNKLQSDKFQKYLDADATITVPSDYYEGILKEADNRIQKLERQLKYAEDNGNPQTAKQLASQIDKVKKIKNSVKDSGITNEEAIFARLHPKLSTAKDITKLSHRAGIQQAKTGALIGGGLSLITNTVSVIKGEKDATDAAIDIVKDTGKGAVVAYSTAFASSAIKAGMQNAGNVTVRALSKSNAPAMIVTSTIDVSKSLKRYCKGEISGVECLTEIGEKGTYNISAAMFAVAGQAIIPIPVVGAMVGSMVGYALSSQFYNELTTALKEAKIAHEERIRIEKECAESIEMIARYREEMNQLANQYFQHYTSVFSEAFSRMDKAFLTGDINEFINGTNSITRSLGADVQYNTMEEFDDFMQSNENFIL